MRKFTNAVQKYFCGNLSTVKFWIICLYFVGHSFEMGHVFNGWNLQVLQLSFYETKMHKGCHKIPLICSKSLTPSMTTFNALSLWRTCAYIINYLKKNKEKKVNISENSQEYMYIWSHGPHWLLPHISVFTTNYATHLWQAPTS